MVAAGAPSSSPMKKPSGSTVTKQAASARPGFQPSAAAQSAASAISSGRIARMRRSDCPVTTPSRKWDGLRRRLSSHAHALGLQYGADLVEDRGIIDGRRHGPCLAVGDLLHGAAEDLAG